MASYKDLITEQVGLVNVPGITRTWQELAEKSYLRFTGPDEIARAQTVALQALTELSINGQVPKVIMLTAVPSTALTVRESNMEECLAAEILNDPVRLKTVTDRWASIENILKANGRVIVLAPEDGWKNLKDSQKVVWKQLSEQYQNLEGGVVTDLYSSLINGAMNRIDSEIFSINAGQAQASQWEEGQPATVKQHQLWFGTIEQPEVHERFNMFIKAVDGSRALDSLDFA